MLGPKAVPPFGAAVPSLATPNIEVRPNTESIASCQACGIQNYVSVPGPEVYQPTGLKLWDLRLSANGYQTTVTKLCGHCMVVIRDKFSETIIEPRTVTDPIPGSPVATRRFGA